MSRAPLTGAKAFTFFDTFKHWRQTPLEVYPCRMHSEIAASVFLWSEHDKHRSTNLFTMKIPWLEWLECKENAVVQSIGEPPDMKVAVLLRGPACSHQEAIRGVCFCRSVYFINMNIMCTPAWYESGSALQRLELLTRRSTECCQVAKQNSWLEQTKFKSEKGDLKKLQNILQLNYDLTKK